MTPNDDLALDHDFRPSDYVGHYVWAISEGGTRVAGRVLAANDARLELDVDGRGRAQPLRWSALIGLHEADELLLQRDALRLISDIADDARLPRWFLALVAREIERLEQEVQCVLPY